MEVSPNFYETITGTIKKVIKKKVLSEGKFHTPPCVVQSIPIGTVYYEIKLEGGAERRERYFPGKPTVIKEKIKLMYFEFPPVKGNSGEGLTSGKKYQFYVDGEIWVSGWKEIAD